jgi:hypothetical protein
MSEMSEQAATAWPESVQRAASSPTSGEESLRRRLLEALMAPVEPRRMAYDEFLAWAGENTLAEWVDGEVVMYRGRRRSDTRTLPIF